MELKCAATHYNLLQYGAVMLNAQAALIALVRGVPDNMGDSLIGLARSVNRVRKVQLLYLPFG